MNANVPDLRSKVGIRAAARTCVREPETSLSYDPRAEARLSRSAGDPETDRPDAVVVVGRLLELVRFAAIDPEPWRFTIALDGQPSLLSNHIADLAREWALRDS